MKQNNMEPTTLSRFACSLLFVLITCSVPCAQPLCLGHERTSLLQFRDSFAIDCDALFRPDSYPKTSSWGGQECCSWDGVGCDNNTGHVVSLDLARSCLVGAFGPESSLFQLSQLQFLNLARNDFGYSGVPSRISNLSRLVHLDLSYSGFQGQIPSEISQLGNLEYLDLSNVIIDSTVPRSLGNLSSLLTISLDGCFLRGGFPEFLLRLPNLQVLDLSANRDLSGPLPEFRSGSSLRKLLLNYTGFSGSLPSSIKNLRYLNELHVVDCQFSGLLPSSLGELKRLTSLILLPSFYRNLTDVTELWLDGNQLSGQIPPWISNLTQLTRLSLGGNKLSGHVPDALSRLANVETLWLGNNDLSGIVRLDMFLDLKNLTELELSGNNFTVFPETSSANATVSKFDALYLGDCNLRKFPSFLRYQEKARFIDLGGNKISGKIPGWVLNMSINSLWSLDFSGNMLTGFEQLSPSDTLPWVHLSNLDLSWNKLTGSLPIPPPSMITYDVSNNSLSGVISPLFCDMTSPVLLDLSTNSLTGSLPKCMVKLSETLSILNLRGNHFQGTIPDMCLNSSRLRGIDLSNNQLRGTIPRSFGSCYALEILNLGNNRLDDVFPSWLGVLPDLRLVLIPRNHLHGTISNTSVFDSEFPKLRIIDLSYNSFSGSLPTHYFRKWIAMKQVDKTNSSYLEGQLNYYPGNLAMIPSRLYSMTIMNKGVSISYEKIQEVFVVIDFSSNRFKGEIPLCIGSLQGMQMLNLSNNLLTGAIPSSLGNITRLESLDLSNNHLSGMIPQQLAQLNFLAFFNVSNNNLSGTIPPGNQLRTFDNTSYLGNPGLCGGPLSNKCGNPETTASEQNEHSESWIESNWMVVLFGYLGGLVIGIALDRSIAARYSRRVVIFLLKHLKP